MSVNDSGVARGLLVWGRDTQKQADAIQGTMTMTEYPLLNGNVACPRSPPPQVLDSPFLKTLGREQARSRRLFRLKDPLKSLVQSLCERNQSRW
ncbi:hypothetical protein Ddc_11108 [Ditylenchus destructor]|nr:hypothetical protein Ddc_11108 [Ditylenchus destructor]